MRGYGDSERPEDVASYKIEHLIEDVRDLIKQLGKVTRNLFLSKLLRISYFATKLL